MGEVVIFPARRTLDRGVIHIWPATDRRDAEIGHQSSNGDNWGGFDHFPTTGEALAAAFDMNRRDYGGRAEIWFHDEHIEGRSA